MSLMNLYFTFHQFLVQLTRIICEMPGKIGYVLSEHFGWLVGEEIFTKKIKYYLKIDTENKSKTSEWRPSWRDFALKPNLLT